VPASSGGKRAHSQLSPQEHTSPDSKKVRLEPDALQGPEGKDQEEHVLLPSRLKVRALNALPSASCSYLVGLVDGGR